MSKTDSSVERPLSHVTEVTEMDALLNERQEYERYLRSAKWKKKRSRAIRRAGNKCQRCGASKWSKLEVHHLTYERLGKEADTDLMVLCQKCHRETHSDTNDLYFRRKRLLEGASDNWKIFNEWARNVYGGSGWWIYFSKDEIADAYDVYLRETNPSEAVHIDISTDVQDYTNYILQKRSVTGVTT